MRLMNCIAAQQQRDLRAFKERLRCRERYRRVAADPERYARRQRLNAARMRRYRADINRRLLCPGVDLPHEAGTCGRMIDPASSRCLRCHNRREQLIRQLNLGELRMLAQVIHAEQIGQDLPGRIGAELQDLADGIEPQALTGGIEAENPADGVEPHAVRRASTPGTWHRRVTLTPLLEDWDDPASSPLRPVPRLGRFRDLGARPMNGRGTDPPRTTPLQLDRAAPDLQQGSTAPVAPCVAPRSRCRLLQLLDSTTQTAQLN